MKIALLSWESTQSIYVGGVAVHVSELAAALARKGQEVHLFTRTADYHRPHETIDGVQYHRVSYSHHTNFVQDIKNMCSALVEEFYRTEHLTGRFDIVHAHDWLTANALIRIKEERNPKTIFTMHSTEYGRCGNNFVGGASQDVSDTEWAGIYHADKVIAVSKTLKNELNWLYSAPEGKIDVVYNGVNCAAFDGWIDALAVRQMYEIEEHDPLILFTGRMVYQKGPDILLESIPTILKYHPHAKFVFVGDGGMRWSVEERARQMGLTNATRFTGHLSGWKIHDLYKTADMVCVPSRNEPFGIVILEAWSAGKPVVASINGGPSEFVWHDVNGYKVQANTESINWGIGTMLADREHAHWMGRNGRLAAETVFSWDSIADQTLGVYSN